MSDRERNKETEKELYVERARECKIMIGEDDNEELDRYIEREREGGMRGQ